MAFEMIAPFEKGQLNQEGDTGYMPSQLLYQFYGCRYRAAGREQVIDYQHTLAGANRIGVDFYNIGAVFQCILDAYRLVREFAKFAYRHETTVQQVGQRGTKNKATRFNSNDGLNTGPGIVGGQALKGSAKGCRILQ